MFGAFNILIAPFFSYDRVSSKAEGVLTMSLRIISGRAGTGKSTFIHNEIIEKIEHDQLGHPIFVIVPDQMSYATEYELTSGKGVQGLMRTQVLTFKRLAWYVLQQTGGIAREEVNGYGYRMLIRQLLTSHKEAFSLFRQSAGKRGFTNEIEMLLQEFSRYSVSSTMLAEVLEALRAVEAPQTLLAKVHDLKVVLGELENRLGTTFVDSEGYYPILTEKLQDAEIMKNAEVYIDGFTAFTLRELELVTELLKVTTRVTIVLPYDSIDEATDEQALFNEAASTALRLHDIAQQHAITIEAPVKCSEGYRFKTANIAHIEKSFPNEAEGIVADGSVAIIEGANRFAEVHAIAREIRKLVQEQGYRYKEIAILYRQAEVYDPLFTTIFPQYDIPVFTNTKKTMLHHPLIELSRSLLEIITSSWQYEPMFRAIKTDLFFPLHSNRKIWRERADRLENFCLSHGIFGERWLEDKRWFYKKYRGLEFHSSVQTDEELATQQEITAIRDLVREPLHTLQQQLQEAGNARAIATALYNCIEQLQVYEKLQVMKARELENHELLAASEHDQAWKQWLAILDQFVYMFGDEAMTLEEAAKLLDEGLEALEFSRIPPSLDEVMVATVDLARLTHQKAVFVIGVNEGVYPRKMDYEGLLSDTERDWISHVGYELAPTSKGRLLQENYLMYHALTLAEERLYITYALADDESKALLPSIYIKKFMQYITAIPIHYAVNDPSEQLQAVDAMHYLRHPRAALPYLLRQLRQTAEGKPLAPVWQALQDYYNADAYWSLLFKRSAKPITEKNSAETLQPHITQALYGGNLQSSVSRIEKFYRCPFSHFTTYGLRLEERAEYRLENFAMGDLFHEALKWISEEIMRRGLQWNRLNYSEMNELALEALNLIVPVFSHQILQSSARYRYIQSKLLHIVRRTVYALHEHAKTSNFRPLAIEASFGPSKEDDLPPLIIPLNGNHQMQLRGRIDRVDSTIINDKPYLRVVDYKSSNHLLNLDEVYYGLSLQVLTYLDVAMTNSDYWFKDPVHPAGVLYVHVQNPMLPLKEDKTPEEIQQLQLKEYKMQGLLVEDSEVLLAMDETLDGGKTSIVIPARINKNNSVSASFSSVQPEEQLAEIQQFVRHKHEEAGNKILAGDTAISPYRLKNRTACDYCNFKSICQFDVTDDSQTYRQLKNIDKNEVVKKMCEELK